MSAVHVLRENLRRGCRRLNAEIVIAVENLEHVGQVEGKIPRAVPRVAWVTLRPVGVAGQCYPVPGGIEGAALFPIAPKDHTRAIPPMPYLRRSASRRRRWCSASSWARIAGVHSAEWTRRARTVSGQTR